MSHLLVVSAHVPSRTLLVRYLGEPGLVVLGASDFDDALSRVAARRPAAVIVDLRKTDDETTDEDSPFFLGLMQKRHPEVPLICLLPGAIRIKDARRDRVLPANPDQLEDLLALVQKVARDVRAQRLLGILNPERGEA